MTAIPFQTHRRLIYPSYSYSHLLVLMAESLNIPEDLEEKAHRSYRTVAEWLGKGDSPLASYGLEIHPQGSFALGTVVRPCTETGEFDLDLLQIARHLPEDKTSEDYRKEVGERMEAHETYKKMLKEKDRCWMLEYAHQFHLDIVPAKPNLSDGAPADSVHITDRREQNWSPSNPIGYAAWFKVQNEKVFEELRRYVAKALDMSVADVPVYDYRTPLQQSVQLLKRHRDLYFANDEEACPASILITTLAAKAYRGWEEGLANSLAHILHNMNEFIVSDDGKFYVDNPSMPGENLARKWEAKPELKRRYDAWHQQACKDLLLPEHQGTDWYRDQLKGPLGETLVQKAIGQYAQQAVQDRQQGKVYSSAAGLTTLTTSTPVKPHTFYGDE